MARFKFLGLPTRPFLASVPPLVEIRLPKKDGTVQVVTPQAPATEFAVDADIGVDVTDERALRAMRVDPKFQEL